MSNDLILNINLTVFNTNQSVSATENLIAMKAQSICSEIKWLILLAKSD